MSARCQMAQFPPGEAVELAGGENLDREREKQLHRHPAAVAHDPCGPDLDRPNMAAHGQDDEGNGEGRSDDDTTAQGAKGGLTAQLTIVFGITDITHGLGGVTGPGNGFDNFGVAE
jgi:hypothetical protein